MRSIFLKFTSMVFLNDKFISLITSCAKFVLSLVTTLLESMNGGVSMNVWDRAIFTVA